jgi:hypothetical protein
MGQASQNRGPTEGEPKPYHLRCKQQCEEQGVLARQFNGHEFNCSAAAQLAKSIALKTPQ